MAASLCRAANENGSDVAQFRCRLERPARALLRPAPEFGTVMQEVR